MLRGFPRGPIPGMMLGMNRQEQALDDRGMGCRSRRLSVGLSALVGIALVIAVVGCSTPPIVPKEGETPPELSRVELERRFEQVRALVAGEQEELAADLMRQSMEERLDVVARRDVLRTLADIRRSQFWRDHPLHASVRLDAPLYRFGDSMHLEIALTNLGASRLELRSRPRNLWERWNSDEHAMIDLTFEIAACDLAGSRVVDRRNLPRNIERDITIEPGATARLDLEIPLVGQRGAVFGIVAVSAVIRPLEITADDTSARYGAIACGGARARVEQADLDRWMRGGLDELTQAMAPGAEDRAVQILLAAGGLEDSDLPAAIDEISRTVEGLAGPSRRLALASAAWILGPDAAADTIGLRAYWLEHRGELDAARLGRLRLGGEPAERTLLAGGALELAVDSTREPLPANPSPAR